MDYLTPEQIRQRQQAIADATFKPKTALSGPALYVAVGVGLFVVLYFMRKKRHGKLL